MGVSPIRAIVALPALVVYSSGHFTGHVVTIQVASRWPLGPFVAVFVVSMISYRLISFSKSNTNEINHLQDIFKRINVYNVMITIG